MPSFSIITPSFNQPEWLQLGAASIADQVPIPHAPLVIEHLVQEGGSADLLDLETRFARNPPFGYQLKIYREADSGMYDAINRGAEKATGEILSYLNCDEQYLPGTLAQVGAYFEAHPEVDLLFGDALLVNASGAPLAYRRVVRPSQLHTRLCHLGVWSCAMFFRRQLWEQGLRFPTQYRAIGDAVFVEKALASGANAAVLPQPLGVFALRDDNLGASAKATEEARRWRGSWGWSGRWLRPLLRLQHWIEKAQAGAYRAQTIDYSIYTLHSPRQRVAFHAESLGWKWPGTVAEGQAEVSP
jgi:glycosyltransferase involved in cell wall biosynthesis